MANNLTTNQTVTINRQRLFSGFSTAGAENTRNFSHYDIDLINIDLMNHFNTRVGERVLRPDFGCKIWDYLMEPFTPTLETMIVTEVTNVCQFDPRLELVNIVVATFEQGIRIDMTLNYIPFSVLQSFTINFEQRQAQLISQ